MARTIKTKKKVILGLIVGFITVVVLSFAYSSAQEAEASQRHVDLIEKCWEQTQDPRCL